MKKRIIHLIKYHFYTLYKLLKKIRKIKLISKRVKVNNKGYGRIHHSVIGERNAIIVGKDSHLVDTIIRIRGNNNKIIFGEQCCVGKNCSFWMEGNDILIEIGNRSTFTENIHFCAQENNQKIVVGEDCMFSNTITVRTSDSHPIYDENGMRINPPNSVYIGNHIWIAPNSKVFKGAVIHDGAIIGSNTMVTKEIPAKSLAVGMPAKIVKSNVSWTREKLF